MIDLRILLCSIPCELICGFDQILCMHWYWYWQDVDLDDWTIFFVHFQQSYGPWLMAKFPLCSISCGPIDGFSKHFVNALILTKCRQGLLQIIFRYFSTELWPLIDVRILFPFIILRTNWWILMKFCVCRIVTITCNFLKLFNRVMALGWC